MQKTRQKILEYLKHEGEATVEDLSHALNDLTPVTIRHHLDVLRAEGLVAEPVSLHRETPGRPRHTYRLTDRAQALFPRNIESLTEHMLNEIMERLSDDEINVIFEGITDRMADELGPPQNDETYSDRLDRVVGHLTQHGYEARWEPGPDGFILHTMNCPYDSLARASDTLCSLDVRYISKLLGVVPRRLAHIAEGDKSCSYLVRYEEAATGTGSPGN